VRECWSTSNPEYLRLIRGVENWLGLRSIAMVICTRIIAGKQSRQVRFYISSLPSNAERRQTTSGRLEPGLSPQSLPNRPLDAIALTGRPLGDGE